jgi:hypothetical protein
MVHAIVAVWFRKSAKSGSLEHPRQSLVKFVLDPEFALIPVYGISRTFTFVLLPSFGVLPFL